MGRAWYTYLEHRAWCGQVWLCVDRAWYLQSLVVFVHFGQTCLWTGLGMYRAWCAGLGMHRSWDTYPLYFGQLLLVDRAWYAYIVDRAWYAYRVGQGFIYIPSLLWSAPAPVSCWSQTVQKWDRPLRPISRSDPPTERTARTPPSPPETEKWLFFIFLNELFTFKSYLNTFYLMSKGLTCNGCRWSLF